MFLLYRNAKTSRLLCLSHSIFARSLNVSQNVILTHEQQVINPIHCRLYNSRPSPSSICFTTLTPPNSILPTHELYHSSMELQHSTDTTRSIHPPLIHGHSHKLSTHGFDTNDVTVNGTFNAQQILCRSMCDGHSSQSSPSHLKTFSRPAVTKHMSTIQLY